MDNNTRNITIHLVILEGPDGVGKSTLRETLVKQCQQILGLDLFLTSPYVVINYAAGKSNYTNLEPERWGDDQEFNFHGSQMEVDLHRFRYSLQINKLTREIAELLNLNPHITNVILIQDRSWVSSVVYNLGNDYQQAYEHHTAVILDMLNSLEQDNRYYVNLHHTYIFIGAENIDAIREHKKQRSEDDYYERMFPLEKLIPAYARNLAQVKEYSEVFDNVKVIEFVNDYDPKTMVHFADAFIEDNLK